MYLSLLKNTQFLKIWIAQLASQLAANLLNFALIIRVYDLTQHSGLANISVSLLIIAFGVPSIIFAVLAGAYVDHMDRRKVLIVSNVARAVLVLLFLFVGTNVWFVYLIVFFISIFSQFFTPAEAAALPRLVKKDQFLAANSLFLFTLYSSFVVGYSLAGPFIGRFGADSVYFITAGAFVLASLLSLSLPQLRASSEAMDFKTINVQAKAAIYSSLANIIRTPQLKYPIFNLTIAQAMMGVIAVLAPGLALAVFGRSLTEVSVLLIVPAAVGMVFGAIAVGQFLKKVNKMILINTGIAMVVVTLLLMGFVPILRGLAAYSWIVVFISLLLGVSNAIVSVSAQTLLQTNSSDEQRGKIFGTLNMMMNIAAVAPVLLAGITADLVSPLTVLTGAGALIGIYGIVQFQAFKRLKLRAS